jgi:5-hydroxyisourate hydrolase
MTLSTHVLDTGEGRPAAGVGVRLERRDGATWTPLAEGRTDADGRLGDLPAEDKGVYRLIFDTADRSDFYPEVTVAFTIADPGQHYHVPLLLSPFAYSTYRGS